MRTKTIAIALALCAWLVPATASNAAPAAPAWQLNLIATPTNLAPGTTGVGAKPPIYLLTSTNIGGAPTTDPVTISATFPAGIVPKSVAGLFADGEGITDDPSVPAPTCGVAAQTVTCTAPGPINPSRYSGAKIRVEVSAALQAGETLPDATASVSGGGAAPVDLAIPTRIDTEPPPFGFLAGPTGLRSLLTNADGSPATQAGGHPDQLTIDFGFPIDQEGPNAVSADPPRDIVTELPRGLIVNPNATERCTEIELVGVGCPDSSQVGMITVVTQVIGPQPAVSPLYNMVPPPGSPATLAFEAANVGIYVHLKGGVRSDGDYGLAATAADTLAKPGTPLLGVQAQLWGDPSSPSHDQIRGRCRSEPEVFAPCQVAPKTTAFLTMPSQCTGPIATTMRARSWKESNEGIEGLPHVRSALSTDVEGNPVGVSGCNQEEFEPTISAKPTTNLADSPSGLDFILHQPQDQELGHIAPANLKDATVTLPKGLVVNPSQAGGLEACSSSQIGLTTPIGQKPIHFTKTPDNCPDAAKIGSLEVTTPLLDHPLPGSVFIAKPFDNPFNSLLAIYLSIDDPQSGTIAKLAGEVIPDPVTGRLTNRFEENPELPLEDVKLHLFPGARAALTTPITCGTFDEEGKEVPHTTTSTLTPWSSPEGLDAHPTDGFKATAAPGGGPCLKEETEAAGNPSFSAGTVLPQAGAYTPFVLKLSRNDGTQRLKGIEATLPPGLAARFAGVATCSEAQIDQAISREKPNMGILEQQSPSCPATSAVGTVNVAAGSGPTPFHTEGTAYLAGPYKGAPLSMAIITPAVAGPFDLGAVVVRTALYVDSVTAQGKAVSDPLPQIIEGIPLDVRSVEVKLDRNRFTLNPTSCEPMQITATSTSALGGTTGLASPFQVGGCKELDFGPKLSLRLKGGTRRTDHPKLIALLRSGGEEANLSRVQVKLPPSAFLDQAHIKTICTRVQFAADTCPRGSIYGRASVKTPLFDEPLGGNVYLRSSNHNLPDLVLDLRGPQSQPIKIEVAGKTDSVKGALRNTFEAVPDAPFEVARVELFGGKRGLIVNSRNICAKRYRATVKLKGQNGKTYNAKPVVKADCRKAKKRKSAHKVAKK
jgi:hypothetical protein